MHSFAEPIISAPEAADEGSLGKEQALAAASRALITRFERKIAASLDHVRGEAALTSDADAKLALAR